jgi:hypothetical protein
MDNAKLSLAAEAHLYGYPLVYNLEMISLPDTFNEG